jgi:hypothetical protein
VAEVEAFDKDVAYMALAFFKTRQTVEYFIESLNNKYPVIDREHVDWTAREEWSNARNQVQQEI